jgi:hypothetical protein
MNLQDVEVGHKYICEWKDGHRYFATVKQKDDRSVQVELRDRVKDDGSPDDPIHRLGTLGPQWIGPAKLHEF